jgi:hypothetical protein
MISLSSGHIILAIPIAQARALVTDPAHSPSRSLNQLLDTLRKELLANDNSPSRCS